MIVNGKCFECGHDEQETKKINCSVCGVEFESTLNHKKGMFNFNPCAFSAICANCHEKIRVVDWYAHHRKTPTKEQLEKEIRKKIETLKKV